jgi:hypothetical protein
LFGVPPFQGVEKWNTWNKREKRHIHKTFGGNSFRKILNFPGGTGVLRVFLTASTVRVIFNKPALVPGERFRKQMVREKMRR